MTDLAATTIVDAEVNGRLVDVRVEGATVVAVGRDLDRSGSQVAAADGGALLPGLHDHHLHLLAMAAAADSLDLARSGAGDPDRFDEALRAAHAGLPSGAWLRVVGLDDRHGPLDRHRLDALAPGRPVRVQHRSGAAWVLSTTALRALALDDDERPGVERDPRGAPTGHLHRLDALLAARLPRSEPALAPLGARLARYGITGVTDATPYADGGAFEVLAAARRRGDLPQSVLATGGPELVEVPLPAELDQGPVKVVVADNDLPSVERLVAAYRAARRAGRPVAVHCVSRVGLVLALAAWEEVGAAPGDRIEHGAVLPVELLTSVRDLDLRVVTQPGFVRDRGDRYRAEVEPDDLPHLYRCGSLAAAGIGVAGSTDAPFGPEDPWVAMAAAVDRATASGAVLGAGEAIEPRQALGLFLGRPEDPGGTERAIVAGCRADLCLLAEPLARALASLSSSGVRATWIGGGLVG